MVPRRRRCFAAKVAPHGAWRDIAGPATGPMDPDYDYMTFPEVVASAVDAYAQARIKDPRQALAMAEVHGLLHADRAGPDGGSRLRRARHRVEGGARRHLPTSTASSSPSAIRSAPPGSGCSSRRG